MPWPRGVKRSEETKRKIAATNTGRIVSDETRRKIGLTHKGKKHSEATKRKLSETHKRLGTKPPSQKGKKFPTVSGKNSPHWKGNKVKYQGLHAWVRKELGIANLCELKDETCCEKFEWSNISHKYKRSLDDFRQLCESHHRRYDKSNYRQMDSGPFSR